MSLLMSAVVKMLALFITLCVLWHFTSVSLSNVGPYTTVYLMHKKQRLLRGALLVLASFLAIQMIDNILLLRYAPLADAGSRLFVSDIVAILATGIVILLYTTQRQTYSL